MRISSRAPTLGTRLVASRSERKRYPSHSLSPHHRSASAAASEAAAASMAFATTREGIVATNYLTPVRTIEDILSRECESDAVVVLNHDLPRHALTLWMTCAYRVCADGGANKVEELRTAYEDVAREAAYTGDHRFKHPNRIVGDMDSVFSSVASMYRDDASYGCTFDDQHEDQDSTDFVKCLRCIVKHQPQIKRVFTLGGLGGRLDHVLYNMKTLFDFPELEIVLIGDSSMARAIPIGETIIKRDLSYTTTHCGLVPLQGDARVTTTGLKWNLNNDLMSFNPGGLISTSNQFASDEIIVRTDRPLLFTSSPSSS